MDTDKAADILRYLWTAGWGALPILGYKQLKDTVIKSVEAGFRAGLPKGVDPEQAVKQYRKQLRSLGKGMAGAITGVVTGLSAASIIGRLLGKKGLMDYGWAALIPASVLGAASIHRLAKLRRLSPSLVTGILTAAGGLGAGLLDILGRKGGTKDGS